MYMTQSSPEFNGQPALPTTFGDNCDRYWEAGLPVIPLKQYTPNGGQGGEPTGKEPAYGGWEEMASRMPTEGERAGWKLCNSTGNIGLPLGSQSGLVAIDIDTDDPRVIKIIDEVLPASPWHRVGQKGRVQLHRWSGQSTVRIKYRDADGKLKSLVEILSTGTQIVLPPSIHPKTVQPYTANCELLDCLDGMVPLPADTEKILREALTGLGYELDGGKPAKARGAARSGQRGQVGEGARNDTLFKEACRLRGADHDEEQVAALLQIFNRNKCIPPLGEDEIAAIAASAMRYDPNEHYTLNDSGNALRFVHDHGERVRFVPDRGVWRVWTETHWADDPGDLVVMRLARETVERMREEAEAITNPGAAKALRAHARGSGDHARLRGMLKVAATVEGIGVRSTAFDQLPGKLAVANGMLDLSSGELSPHDPANLNTRCVPTPYDPEAQAPKFLAALERTQPDPIVRLFLQTFIGQALHGTRPEQLMVWMHGRGGRNGKSFLADLLLLLLPGYAIETSASSFVSDDKRNPNAPRSDLTRLQGSRLVFGQESNDRRRLDGPRLKQLTGDSSFTARANHQDEGGIPVTFSLMVLTNPLPNADEADDALWSRFVRVPYDVVIPREERIPDYYKIIYKAEAAGVLAWAVRGATSYAHEGLTIPASLIEATAEWRRRIGTVERYMKTYTRRSEGGSLGLLFLHSGYTKVEQQHHGNPIGVESFRTRLEQLGYAIEDGETGETVLGVRPVTIGGAAGVPMAA